MQKYRAEETARSQPCPSTIRDGLEGRLPPDELCVEALTQRPARSLDRHRSWLLADGHDRKDQLAGEFRQLRDSLLNRPPVERSSWVITSAESGEGKTMTCLNLAIAMTERADRLTVVVDFDLREPRAAGLLCAKPGPGMADLLRGTHALKETLQQTDYPNLFFLSGGEATGQDADRLVRRPEVETCIQQLKLRFDYVLFDTPPINSFPDAGIVGRNVNAALLAVRTHSTRPASVQRAIHLLGAAGVSLSGVVLTSGRSISLGRPYAAPLPE